MKPIKNRTTPLMSKRKVVTAINLYETYVDAPVDSIKIITSTLYEFKTYYCCYSVDIAHNKVKKIYPDIE